MATMLNVQSYPKTVALRDGTRVQLRPLEPGDKIRLLKFFERIPEEERYHLKENVTAPEVISEWIRYIDLERVIPIVGVMDDQIVADATLHRSRASARRHMGELRVVVDPAHRERGLGGRLLRELIEIASDLGLHKLYMELVEHREKPAIQAALSLGFQEVACLAEWVRDAWGNYESLVVLELPLKERELWWRY